ncbi:MAG: ABC transporter substrate-binding protein [Evtepia gabavorous]
MNLVQALYLNNDVEPFDNEKVRQAMCYAVNVDEILNLTGEGHGKKLGSSIYPAFTKYFDESLADYYTYDVEGKAAAEGGRVRGRVLHDHHRALQLHPHMNVAQVLVGAVGPGGDHSHHQTGGMGDLALGDLHGTGL